MSKVLENLNTSAGLSDVLSANEARPSTDGKPSSPDSVASSKNGPARTLSLEDILAHLNVSKVLSTNDAAYLINRRPQTLRRWACEEDGPLRPLRINGRLAWRVNDLLAILAGDGKETNHG